MTVYRITPKKEETLRKKMLLCGVREKDLTENFIRSGGRGGQHVNKTSTCVYLKHVPTGIEVKCARERSQSINRFLARKILTEKIEKMAHEKAAAEKHRREKLRRQKRGRSKKGKERMLAEKRKRSEKKALRGKIRHAAED
jgi:protein subunit release factor B